jgi:hypothetical protein
MATRRSESDVPDVPEDVVDEAPEPMRHPAAPDYVLKDGQWVLEPQVEAEAETEKPEE